MNKKISLLVLAAGMGSRYGGLKQMEGFGPNGETIIDYSVYDAINAGFEKVVFIIRPDMEGIFKELFMDKYGDKITIEYVFQSVEKLPSWYNLNLDRVKPWGTGHALLMAKDVLKEPFLVINGDDFYGKDSFEIAAKYLKEDCSEKEYAIPAYRLENVLSENGTVKRGVCTQKDGYLEKIDETFDIARDRDGNIKGVTWDGKRMNLKDEDLISMNLFCLHNNIFEKLEKRFEEFLKKNPNSLEDEYLLPIVLSDMVQDKEIKIKILETTASWFGVTYQEDGPVVRKKIEELIQRGIYPKKVF